MKVAMTEITLTRLNILQGEGSMMRELIRSLKAKEAQTLCDLRDILREIEQARMRLEAVNAEIGRLSNATRGT